MPLPVRAASALRGLKEKAVDHIGVVMTRCPTTGREIETGIEIDRRSFASLPFFIARVECPACGGYHEWSNKDAWLCDSLAYPDLSDALARIKSRTDEETDPG